MNPQITLTIDGQRVTVEEGASIMDAAQCSSISIPHLCAYPGLKPFGGCRLCIVEVDGLRGFPTACTTPVTKEMVVRTQTPEVQKLRQDILQLLLSEHPSSCLFCEESQECQVAMITTRKGEAITGCRSCPKDGQCELQEVVQQVGLKGVDLPFHYRNLAVEKYDPFYDRDYNLCILCGRCVRVCQDVRLADVLTFKQRGPATLIGPAYDRSHLDSGCEFCGDCVTVCPTGALSEKTIKWAGKPESSIESTCPYCSLGCSLELLIKSNEVIGSRPLEDGQTQGQLCVKGRFATCEVLNNPDRLTHPIRLQQGMERNIHWEEAIDLAARTLSACPSGRFGMRVSVDCTNEDLYVARKFTREVMHSQNISSRVAEFYDEGFPGFASLVKKNGRLSSIQNAKTLFSIGLDGRFGWSVVSLDLKRAVQNGAKLFTAFPREHYLSRFASTWLLLDTKALVEALQELLNWIKNRIPLSDLNLMDLAKGLVSTPSPVIILGPEYLQGSESAQLFRAVIDLAKETGAEVLPLAPQSNLAGLLHLGIGSASVPVENFQVLYLIGELPSPSDPPTDFLIYQNFASFSGLRRPDLSLPSAAFSELDGTLTNLEGQPRLLHKAVEPPEFALPDWKILCQIAQKMGVSGFDYPDTSSILREMDAVLPGSSEDSKASLSISKDGYISGNPKRSPFPEDVYRGFPLKTWVEGLRSLEFDI